MRLLIDRCAGRRIADWLREAGHDVRTGWAAEPDPGDEALLRMAAEEGRILVTIDSDFATLVYRFGARHAGIIRLPDVPAAARIAIMTDLIVRHGDRLAGEIVTVRGNRIRFSSGSVSL